jgi:hypothetical protein
MRIKGNHGMRCNAKTIPMKCRYCGEAIFYFTCDCGCRVILERPRPPWEYHKCVAHTNFRTDSEKTLEKFWENSISLLKNNGVNILGMEKFAEHGKVQQMRITVNQNDSEMALHLLSHSTEPQILKVKNRKNKHNQPRVQIWFAPSEKSLSIANRQELLARSLKRLRKLLGYAIAVEFPNSNIWKITGTSSQISELRLLLEKHNLLLNNCKFSECIAQVPASRVIMLLDILFEE